MPKLLQFFPFHAPFFTPENFEGPYLGEKIFFAKIKKYGSLRLDWSIYTKNLEKIGDDDGTTTAWIEMEWAT